MVPPRRMLAELASPEIAGQVKTTSILCLPLGAIEQHGPHLPLNTDVIVAEGLASRMVARWGKTFDLWQLPTLSLGLSREHDWAAGTLSLSIDGFLEYLRGLAGEIVRALPARNLAIINGHGGNRGILENVVHELRGDYSLNCCVIHPFDLSKVPRADSPDVHAGRDETSVMLVLAPDLVRKARVATVHDKAKALHDLVFDRGVTWPWRTDDPHLAQAGVIGDSTGASAKLGRAIVESIVSEAGAVFARLIERLAVMSGEPPARSRRRRGSSTRTSSRTGSRRRPRSKETS